MIDYHIHTLLCNHAEGGLKPYAEAAVRAGIGEIAFLEHLSFDPEITGHAMALSEVPLYFFAIQELKKAFQGRLVIRAGLEIDYAPHLEDKISELTRRFDFDLLGGSIHFVDGVNIASRRQAKSMDDATFNDLALHYAAKVCELVKSGLFDVACHLDVIKKNGRTLPLGATERLHEALDTMAENGMALEVNAGGLHHPTGSYYPDHTLITQAISKGVPLTTGSDAHQPHHAGRGIAEATAHLHALGATHITRFHKRQGIPEALSSLMP